MTTTTENGKRRRPPKEECCVMTIRDVPRSVRNCFAAACELHGISMRKVFMGFMKAQVREWRRIE